MTSSASYRQTECSASQRTRLEFTVIAELPVFVSSEGVTAPQALCWPADKPLGRSHGLLPRVLLGR